MNKRISTLILSVLTIFAFFTIISYGDSPVTNVSTNCNVTSFQAGDEVKLQVNTKEMSICTFIAYVEYDWDLLQYRGFEGGFEDDQTRAYLEKAKKSKQQYVEVTVEQSESNPIIGLYMVGTTENRYLASSPLVTLVFTAKKSGVINEETFTVAETSDGTDGFTSESIKQAVSELDDDEGKKGIIESINISNSNIFVTAVLVGVVVTIVVIAIIIIKKKRKNE